MSVTDRKMHKDAESARRTLVVPITTAVSQTDKEVFKYRPGFAFEVTDVQAYCQTEAGAVTVNVKVNAVTILTAQIAMASATRVAGVLVAALATLRGTDVQDLTVEYTSDGTGALTNGTVSITIRPIPMNQDIRFA